MTVTTRSCNPWNPEKHGDGATCMTTMSSVADVAPNGPQLVDTPDTDGAYPRLSDRQIATLECFSLCHNRIDYLEPPIRTGQFRSVPGHWR